MARGVNKVILVGNVGNEPEIKSLPSGVLVANISIATNESWTDKQTGTRQEKTEWHRVVFFGRTAEIVQQYVHKGSQLYVEGRLRTNKWQDQQGNQRYTTEIIGNEMQLLGRVGDNNSPNNAYQPDYNSYPQANAYGQQNSFNQPAGQVNMNPQNNFSTNQQPQNNFAQNSNANDLTQNVGGFDDYDDEIPF